MHLASKIKVYRLIPIFLLAGWLIFFSSCNGRKTGNIFKEDYLNVDAFQNSLYQRLRPVDTSDPQLEKRLVTDMDLNVTYAYQLGTYRPFWFDRSGLLPAGEALPGALKSLSFDGLDPDDYNLARIRQIVLKARNSKVGILDSVQHWDAEMTKAYLTAARDLIIGIPELKPDTFWHIHNDEVFNGAVVFSKMMDTSVSFPTFDSFRPAVPAYHKLRDAVKKWRDLNQDSIYLDVKKQINVHQDSLIYRMVNKELGLPYRNFNADSLAPLLSRYQRIHSLKATGEIDPATLKSLKQLPEYYLERLLRNMERLRELPRDMGTTYLWLNTYTSRGSLVKMGTIVFSTQITTTSDHKKMPSISTHLTRLVVNPGTPVAVQSVSDGIREKGAAYLQDKEIHAYDSSGKEVTRAITTSTDINRITFRRFKDAKSPFGKIQFVVPNQQHIILCDTLNPAVGHQLTSGSTWLRVQNAEGLASVLLNLPKEKTDALLTSTQPKMLKLKYPVPVYLIQLDVDMDPKSGKLIYYNQAIR